MACHVNPGALCSFGAERERAPNKKTLQGFYLTNQPAVAVEVGVRTPLAAALGYWSGANGSRGE